MAKRAGSRNWYFKRDYPVDVAKKAREQFWRSLRSPDQKKAAELYADKAYEFEAIVKERRQGQSKSNDAQATDTHKATTSLSQAAMNRLTDEHYKQLIDEDFARRSELFSKCHADRTSFWKGQIVPFLNDENFYLLCSRSEEANEIEPVIVYCLQNERKQRLDQLETARMVGNISGLEAKLSTHDLQADEKLQLGRSYLDAEIRATRDLIGDNSDRYDKILSQISTVSADEQRPTPSPTNTMDMGKLFSAHLETYIAEGKRKKLKRKTVVTYTEKLTDFIEICGDKPIREYTLQADGVNFKSVLEKLPKNPRKPKANHGKTLFEIADAYQGPNLLAVTTINDKISCVSAFFDWLVPLHLDKNPIPKKALVIAQRGKKKRKTRTPFTPTELRKMFQAPIFTGCKSSSHWKAQGDTVLMETAKFWVPVIGLFTGLRLGEIIQLRTEDIQQQDGVWHIDVLEVTTDDDGFQETDTQLKTEASRRKMPIHAELIKIGFLDFVRKRNTPHIFPDYAHGERENIENGRDNWVHRFSSHFRTISESNRDQARP